MLIKINNNNIDDRLIEQAVNVLKKGGLVIFPTDTVYAIGCDLYNKNALYNLALIKKVKLNKAKFSIIFSSLSNLSEYVKPIERRTYKILNKSLPGPFTFILEATNKIPHLFENKKKEIGIRIPDNKIITKIVSLLGNPIATTSLKDSEDKIQEYYTDPNIIYENFHQKAELIIDGGSGNLEPSTIVNCIDQIKIIRQGIGKIEL